MAKLVADALRVAESDEAAARIRAADAQARTAPTEALRAAAADEARRLRLERITSLTETAAWRSPRQLSVALEAYGRAADLTPKQLDEMTAALAAVQADDEEAERAH